MCGFDCNWRYLAITFATWRLFAKRNLIICDRSAAERNNGIYKALWLFIHRNFHHCRRMSNKSGFCPFLWHSPGIIYTIPGCFFANSLRFLPIIGGFFDFIQSLGASPLYLIDIHWNPKEISKCNCLTDDWLQPVSEF